MRRPGASRALTPLNGLISGLLASATCYGDEGYNAADDEATLLPATGMRLVPIHTANMRPNVWRWRSPTPTSAHGTGLTFDVHPFGPSTGGCVTERTWAIVNPAAGGGRAGREWPALAATLRRASVALTQCVTCGPGDGVRCAATAVRDGADLVIAVGGDGTLGEVVTGCLLAATERPPRLAVLPLGTGADFARCLGITLTTALAAIADGVPRAVDVGRARFLAPDGAPGERYFLNVADLGLGPRTSLAIRRGPRRLGAAAYLYGALASIAAYAPEPVRVAVDGAPVFAGPAGLVAVANGVYFGGGMRLAPGARPDDGAFDVVTLAGTTRRVLATDLLPRVYRGAHLGHSAVRLYRGREVHVEACGGAPWPLETDGEVVGTTPVTIELLPRAVEVLTPAR
ncbi:MAG TPA: diacylglycerol kinase family protein [Thermomicrobiales bacterium]|nr:diacylglycerol kinase family protein [Thermomicrobiales bacterium]